MCELCLNRREGFSFFPPIIISFIIKSPTPGCLGGAVVKHLPLAQVMIPGSWDQAPQQAPHREPASPSAYVSASLSVSLMNK